MNLLSFFKDYVITNEISLIWLPFPLPPLTAVLLYICLDLEDSPYIRSLEMLLCLVQTVDGDILQFAFSA